jgi:hypothetical protein
MMGVFRLSAVRSIQGFPNISFAPDVVFLTRIAAIGTLRTTPNVGVYLNEPTVDMKEYREKISGSSETSDTDFLAALRELSKFPISADISKMGAFGVSVLAVALWGLRWRKNLIKELSNRIPVQNLRKSKRVW